MDGWDDIRKHRNLLPSLTWWDSNKLLFRHDFRLPFKCKNMLIVIGRSGKVSFAGEKLKRITSLIKDTAIYLFLEDPDAYGNQFDFTADMPDGNHIYRLPADTPVSASIAKHMKDGKIPLRFEASILFAPYTSYDDMLYICQLPIVDYLKTISDAVYTLDNRNLLMPYSDPLEDYRDIAGKRIFGFASLTNEDVKLLHKYARLASGGLMVELGRFLGGSTNIIASAIRDSGKKTEFHSFDPLLPESVHKTLAKNALADYAIIHKVASREAYETWGAISGGKEIDFLFIDADHSYEGVTFDLTSWGSIVKKGGVIIAHDYCNFPEGGLAGVDVAINNALLDGKFEVLESCYASIAVRKK